MKEAVGYCRVSSTGQQTNGTGLDRQEAAIRAYAEKAGYTIVKIYQEAFTGTETERPVFESMLCDILDNGCRTVIVECLDRLARDLSVQLQIISLLASKGVVLINAMTGQDATNPSDAMSKAMIQVQGVFAELDKNLLVRKLRKGREAKKQETGRCEGRKPFGYYPGEAETLTRIKSLYRKVKGKKRRSFAAIARVLNAEGVPTRIAGKRWHSSTIARILNKK